jgi:uncharacterized membrane protein
MIANRTKISSPVGVMLSLVGVIMFVFGLFLSIYYMSNENYLKAVEMFLAGMLSLAICSGLAEIIYQLLKLRRRIIEMLSAKNEKTR